MWSVGALLELEDRAKMEAFIKEHESNLDLPPLTGDETIFEYLVDEKGFIFTFIDTSIICILSVRP